MPSFPPLPPPQASPAALLADAESGRLPEGGIYAHFAVAASPAQVYAVLADDAGMSAWIPHLSRSEIVIPGQPCNRVAFAVPSPIGTVEYQLDRCHQGLQLWWTLAVGDRFDAINGGYQVEGFSGGTLVHYWSQVIARIPVPTGVQEEVARIGIGDLVTGLRKEVARRTTSGAPAPVP